MNFSFFNILFKNNNCYNGKKYAKTLKLATFRCRHGLILYTKISFDHFKINKMLYKYYNKIHD